ncbi:hypothetical protein SNE40_023182 [Patella caerulea]|uniref:Integrase catalytic domain-containing protein n=1 Tax=Patella caerulea TaxID=87958 RepID=A0AAN8IVU4_PATCE
MDKKLARVYYDPKHPAGFGGATRLQKATGVPLKRVRAWLRGQRTYTLHKPIRKRFSRLSTVVAGVDHQWQADLSDLSSLASFNDGYKFLLCIIDVFSKYAWVVPLKNKTGPTLLKAFQSVLSQKRIPLRLQTDKGTEFLNRHVQAFLKKKKIHFFVTHNVETKASVVERFQRTLKQRMWRYFTHRNTQRYIDVLADLVRGYNAARHRTIGMAPKDMTPDKEWQITSKKTKVVPTRLPPRTSVRLALPKHGAFDKGYWPNWTLETFRVDRQSGSTYKLLDERGEPIAGSFYPQELQSVRTDPNEEFPIERVLDRRRGDMLVKWLGYPASFNSWIPKSAVVYK